MNGLDLQIEEMHKRTGMSYIDTIIDFSEQNGLDFEEIVKEIHSSILDKVKNEYVERNMVDGRENKSDNWKAQKNETGFGELFK